MPAPHNARRPPGGSPKILDASRDGANASSPECPAPSPGVTGSTADAGHRGKRPGPVPRPPPRRRPRANPRGARSDRARRRETSRAGTTPSSIEPTRLRDPLEHRADERMMRSCRIVRQAGADSDNSFGCGDREAAPRPHQGRCARDGTTVAWRAAAMQGDGVVTRAIGRRPGQPRPLASLALHNAPTALVRTRRSIPLPTRADLPPLPRAGRAYPSHSCPLGGGEEEEPTEPGRWHRPRERGGCRPGPGRGGLLNIDRRTRRPRVTAGGAFPPATPSRSPSAGERS